MKLTVVGATGGVGGQLVRQSVTAGHEVTALVRDPSRLPAGVRAVRADLATATPADLVPAVAGADAVLSGLGPRTRADTGIVHRGTRAVVAAMREAGVHRIVVVSAAPVGTVPSPDRPHPPRRDPGDGPAMRYLLAPLIKAVFRASYADLALLEDDLRASSLDWTVVRPPYLTNGPLTARYRTALGRNVRGGLRVSRADVAHLMLAVLSRPETVGTTVGVGR